MIELTEGDLLKADVEALVNAVNTVGVMGKGLALQFKEAYPKMFAAYRRACDSGALQPGLMHVYGLPGSGNPRYIINFPTKKDFRLPSHLGYIRSGLLALVTEIRQRNIHSLALPALGCGLGGLNWSDVFPLIQEAFAPLPEVRVLVYAPGRRGR